MSKKVVKAEESVILNSGKSTKRVYHSGFVYDPDGDIPDTGVDSRHVTAKNFYRNLNRLMSEKK